MKLTRGPRSASSAFPANGWPAYHEKSTRHARKILPDETILPEMLGAGAVASAMTFKTKSSVLRDLVTLADKTGQLNDPKTLLESLEAREELVSTAMPGGFALPHPRAPEPYLFETSFIVVGRPVQEIHFGAPDGRTNAVCFFWFAARTNGFICTRWRGFASLR